MNRWPQQSIQEVADGIFAVVHGKGEVGVANASFILEENSAFLIDSMTFPEMAANIAREITHRGARVDTVLNTHHHVDHIGGNRFFNRTRTSSGYSWTWFNWNAQGSYRATQLFCCCLSNGLLRC